MESWSWFVKGLEPGRGEDGRWANSVLAHLDEQKLPLWRRLAAERAVLTGEMTVEPYQRWALRIARFSFLL